MQIYREDVLDFLINDVILLHFLIFPRRPFIHGSTREWWAHNFIIFRSPKIWIFLHQMFSSFEFFPQNVVKIIIIIIIIIIITTTIIMIITTTLFSKWKSLWVLQKARIKIVARAIHTYVFFYTYTLLFCWKIKSCCDCYFPQQIRSQTTV